MVGRVSPVLQQPWQLVVVDGIRDPVRAEKKAVARLESHGADLRGDKLVVGPERTLEDVAAGMVFCFALVQLPVAEKPAHVGVVVGQLLDAARGGEVVDPAVADVPEIHPPPAEPAEA